MLVVAYFHYDTGRSNIQSFTNDIDAKNWLYEHWGFLLSKEQRESFADLSFEQFCMVLREECSEGGGSGVVVEYMQL